MLHRPTFAPRLGRVFGATAVLFTLSSLGGSLRAADTDVDASCPWGRLADGKGKFVRCLTREEAARLRDAAPAASEAAKPSPPPPAPAVPAPQAPAPLPPPAPPPPAEATKPVPPAPPVVAITDLPPADPDPPAEGSTAVVAGASPFEVEIGPVTADTGALPEAVKSLRKAGERYLSCVNKHGGGDPGTVELRFLVQGRGRAEGVSIKKRKGVPARTAQCFANVIDRRYVGYPEAPEVGATLVVTVSKKKR
jgi:hypothetical protein